MITMFTSENDGASYKVWSRWRFKYLQSLQVRQKWEGSQPNVEKDDIVLVKDDQSVHNS